MHHTNIKIAELLNALDNYIIDEIKIKLESDKNNKPEIILLLVAIYKNKINNTLSTTENLHKTIYKKQKRTPNEFRKLCHELLLIVETYLATYALQNNELLQKYLLLEFYKKQQLFSFYDSIKNKLDKTEYNLLSTSTIQINNLYNESYYETLVEDKSRASENYITSFSDALDEYYILQKLKLICHSLNEQHFTTYSLLPNYTETILNIDSKQHNELVQYYYAIAKLLQDVNNEKKYFVIKKDMQNCKTIRQNDMKVIIQYLINFCIIKINKGSSNYIQEIFEMYKLYDNKIEETQISPVRFKNIINIAIRLKEYNYAFQYIEKNGKKLPVELQTSTIEFNKAKLYYEQKKYNNAIEILRAFQHDDIIFNLSAKVLLVQSFYEKKEFQFLESFLESFRIYVLRSKEINTASKKVHQDFIKIIHRLMKMEFASTKETEAFKNKIISLENLPDKAWVLEKLDEL